MRQRKLRLVRWGVETMMVMYREKVTEIGDGRCGSDGDDDGGDGSDDDC